jgi:hypothetical protein
MGKALQAFAHFDERLAIIELKFAGNCGQSSPTPNKKGAPFGAPLMEFGGW